MLVASTIATYRSSPEPAWHRNRRSKRQTARGIIAAVKLGFPILPAVAAAAELRLATNHSIDTSMVLPQWRLDQIAAEAATRAVAEAVSGHGGKGAYGKWFKGSWDMSGPKGKAGGKGYKGGKTQRQGEGKGGEEDCTRCGGQHRASQCPRRTSDQPCHKCGHTGHTGKMCKSKRPFNEETCTACGETGHTKKKCPHQICTKCGEKGHTPWFCNHHSGPETGQSVQQSQQAPTATACQPCGPDNQHEYKWICEPCGCLVKDDGNVGVKRPACTASREKKTYSGAVAKSVLPKMKAVSDATYQRNQRRGAHYPFPITPRTQSLGQKRSKRISKTSHR